MTFFRTMSAAVLSVGLLSVGLVQPLNAQTSVAEVVAACTGACGAAVDSYLSSLPADQQAAAAAEVAAALAAAATNDPANAANYAGGIETASNFAGDTGGVNTAPAAS